MLEQLRHSIPIPGILLQANQDKLFRLIADQGRLREFNLILHDLDEIPLGIYVKWHPSK